MGWKPGAAYQEDVHYCLAAGLLFSICFVSRIWQPQSGTGTLLCTALCTCRTKRQPLPQSTSICPATTEPQHLPPFAWPRRLLQTFLNRDLPEKYLPPLAAAFQGAHLAALPSGRRLQ